LLLCGRARSGGESWEAIAAPALIADARFKNSRRVVIVFSLRCS
jgi:hypothetical protein